MRNFSTICLKKSNNKNEPVRVFISVFSYRKPRDGFLTYSPGFVVLYLKVSESIDQLHENTFFAYSFTEMSLMTSSTY